MKNSSFSVVTPNLNMGQYLGYTIESVIRNLRPGDQYFVIDGGSTDNSIEVIRSYENHLTGWISEPDKGYADALDKGFKQASGEYMCWINSGDLLLDGALKKVREILVTTNADMIFGDDLYIDETGKVISASNGYVKNLSSMMLYGGWTPLQDACYWRASLYNKVGGIDPLLRYAADYDLFLRLCLNGKCCYAPYTFSAFRRHAGQTSIKQKSGYSKERAYCQRRELALHGMGDLQDAALRAYFWFAVRFRSRLFARQRGRQKVWGLDVGKLSCYPNN